MSIVAASLRTPACPRYASLDIYRGIACLMVVIFHSTTYVSVNQEYTAGNLWSMLVVATERMWIGVPMFFVISGYCIAATADSTRRRSPSRTANYFVRRFRRIFPPFWIALGLLAVCSLVLEYWLRTGVLEDDTGPVYRMWWFSGRQLLGNFTLTESWLSRSCGERPQLALGQAWTLCYEEQFYAIVGILLWLSPRRFFLNASLLSLATIPFIGAGFARGFFFDGYWLMFAAGILVYHAVNYQSTRQRWASGALLLLCLALAMYPARQLLVHKVNDLQQSFFVAFAFALCLLAFRPLDQAIVNHWSMRPFVWCGAMCFSLYLVHWPLVKIISGVLFRAGFNSDFLTCVLTIPLCLVASLIAGRIFYRLVERRFLNTTPANTTREPNSGAAVVDCPAESPPELRCEAPARQPPRCALIEHR